MNIKDFAALLNGREYREEISEMEEKLAKDNGFVVVFGASDDCMEFRGAIYNEIGCYEGREVYLTPDKELLVSSCEDCDKCRYFKKALENCVSIKALWCNSDWCWTYETQIPHETFEIYEDGDPYCKGIVFDLKQVVRLVVSELDKKLRIEQDELCNIESKDKEEFEQLLSEIKNNIDDYTRGCAEELVETERFRENIKHIETTTGERHRWSIEKTAVYCYKNQYFALNWLDPATEGQEGQETDCKIYEVKPVNKTITEFK